MMPVYVLTSDAYTWLLPGFAWLFNKYWDDQQPVTVVGYNPPAEKLPDNFAFQSISKRNYPAGEWSNGVMEWLHTLKEDWFILLLEDYWIRLSVDVEAIQGVYECVQGRNDILKVDLTDDRSSNKFSKLYSIKCPVQLISTPYFTQYQMSMQAAIWNRLWLYYFLRPCESPWETEINGTQRIAEMRDCSPLVLGTDRILVDYAITARRFHPDKNTGIKTLRKADTAELQQLGYLHEAIN